MSTCVASQPRDILMLSKNELMSINQDELQRHICALKVFLSRNNHRHQLNDDETALCTLQSQLKSKQSALQRITNQIDQYFMTRKGVISKNKQLSTALHQLRCEFNEEMYKMENIKLMVTKTSTQDTAGSPTKLSEIEKLKKSHHELFAEMSRSFLPENECDKIDQLLVDRTQLIGDIASIHKHSVRLQRERTSNHLRNKIYNELVHILSTIHSLRGSRSKREEVLTASIGQRKKQKVNAEIVEATRKEQRESLEDKLQGIEDELEEFTNLNAYGSPSVSVRGSVNLKEVLRDNVSVISDASQFEVSQMMESKQTVHSLIQYLQDFLPLTMRKQIETLKMKAMSDGNEQEIEAVVKEMTLELQQMRPGGERESGKGNCPWYLNHNMSTFDEFDQLDIKIPLILCDVPEVIKTLLDRIRSIQHMNKCFAIV